MDAHLLYTTFAWLTAILKTGSECVRVRDRVHDRRFLFVSFDPDAAGAAGLKTFCTEAILYASFALMISVATRAIGALPAFGLMVLPALTGLRLARSMRADFVIASASGALVAGLGYYASFALELPTGASMVALAGLIYLATLVARHG